MSKSNQKRVLLRHTLANIFVRVVFAILALGLITSVISITRTGQRTVYAAAPTTLNFQARLLSSTGTLVPDGDYNIEFKLYNASSSSGSSQGSCTGDANCLWTESRTGGNKVEVKNGYLSAYLGDVSALPTDIWDQQLWLTMNIGGTGAPGWDGEMTPRIRLTSVPYAFRATVASSAETLSKDTGSFTGTVDFSTLTADRTFLFPDTSLATTGSPGTICVYNGAASNCPAASGSAYYIQNDTVLQTAANFNIQARDSATNGTVGGVFRGAAAGQTVDLLQFQSTAGSVLAAVTAAGNLQVASLVDTRAAGTLNIGTTNATAISLDQNTTVAAAKTLTVTSGATSLTGATSGDALTVSNSTSTGNILTLKDNSTTVLSVADGGATTFQNSSNSTSAVAVKNAAGDEILRVDSTGESGNVITNGSVEQNTTNWAAMGGSTVTRVTTPVLYGVGSLSVATTAAANDGAKYNVTLSASTQYTASFYAKLASGSFTNMKYGYSDDGTTGGEVDCKTGQTVVTSGWTQFNCTFTTSGTISGTPYFYIKQATATSRTFYIDGFHMITGSNIGAYYNGSANSSLIFNQLAVQNSEDSNTAFQVQASNGTSVLDVDTINKRVGIGTNSPNARLHVSTVTSDGIGLIVKGVSSQSADLLQLVDNNNTTLTRFDASGNLQLAGSLDTFTATGLSIGTTNATSLSVGKAGATTTINGALTVTEATTLNGGLTVSNGGNVAFQRNTTDISTTGTLTDLSLGTGALFRFTGASTQTLSSIASPADGRIVTLINAAAQALVIQNDTGGTAANRIITGTGSDTSVPAGASVTLTYDSSSSRWRLIGSTATSGGGANQQLSNLSGTVAVNASLTPGTDNTLDLGSGANSWRTLYADTSVLTPSVDVASAGALSIGNTTATSVSICNSANCDTIDIGTNADADVISVGDASDTVAILGTLSVNTTGTAGTSIGNATGTLTVTGSSSSSFVLNGITISTAEFNLLDGKDTALVDTTDAVTTAITGTGALASGSIAAGFGTIETANTITGTTINGTTGINTGASAGTQRIDASGNLVNIGNLTATAGITIQSTGAGSDVTLSAVDQIILNAGSTIELQDNTNITGNLAVSGNTTLGDGVTDTTDITGSLATKRGADYTTAGSANDVNFGGASLVRLDTSGAAQTITGIASGRDGLILTLVNADASANVTLSNNSGSSSAGNKIVTGTGADVVMPAGSSVTLIYDSNDGVWRVISGVALAGGGANQQLSNLSGTVAVNASLTPGTDNTLDLGSGANSWRTLYADTSVLTPSVDVASATTLNVGTTTATAVSISRTGVTTTVNGALTVTEAGTFNGGLTVASNFTVTNGGNVAFQRSTTDYSSTGTQDDINFGTGVLFRITSATALTITSVSGGVDGRIITLANASSNAVTLQNDSGGTAANRIITGTGSNLSVPAGSTVQLAYDSSSSRWRVIGGTATSGGAANQQLSNLSGTVAVNASLTPGTDNTLDLGSSSFSWRTVYADTSVLSSLFDVASAGALNVGTTSATNVTIGHNAGTFAVDATNFDLSTAGVLTLAGAQAADITTAAASTANGITIKPGNSTGASVAGATLTLQGGNATSGNANGGDLVLNGGTGVGSGTKGLVVVDTATFSAATTQAFTGSGNITQANIDGYGTIRISSNAAGYVATLTDPTNTTAGRVVYVTNTGAYDMTLSINGGGTGNTITLKPSTTATMVWNGVDWTAAGASSSTDLQAAYNNTATSAGGAELVLNASGGAADGLTIRNNGTSPIVGGILEVQSSIGSNLLSVNNNSTEYAVNGGAETATNFSTNWTTTTGGTVTQSNDATYFATGQYAVKTVTAATANQGAKNVLSAALTSGMTYSVSLAVKGTSNFTTLEILYSPDGTTSGTTTCATGKTVTSGTWSRILCTFTAAGTITSSNAILIRQTNAVAHTWYTDNLSVTVNANMTFAADGSVDSALGTNWTQYDADGGAGTTTVTRSTTTIYDTTGSVSDVTTAHANEGVRNNMAVTPVTGTQYLITFYAQSSNTFNDITVGFLAGGGNGAPTSSCTDYNTQSVGVGSWTKITCLLTTSGTITDPDLVIYQPTATARTFYIDALTINLNNNNSNNVQIGGANKGGPTTLLTLDRASSAPIAANNDAYLGSMYYDTTTGRIQCYEADGWGACGSSPDNIIVLTPEYTGAVLNGSGVGTMTADFCSNESGVLSVGSLCANHEARNYYRWTSPQATSQTYSIYVTYKLPSTFKAWNDSNTIKLTALTDSTSNASATIQVFKKESDSSAVASCGSATTINSSASSWQTTNFGGDETACGFGASDVVIFKIDMAAKSNANIYVENLEFTFTNN